MLNFKRLFKLIVVFFICIRCCISATCETLPSDRKVSIMFGVHAKEFIIEKDDKSYFLIVKNPYPNALWVISNPSTQTSTISSKLFFDKWVAYGKEFSLDNPHIVIANECLIDKDCKMPPVTFSLDRPTKLNENTWRFEIAHPPGFLQPRVIEDGIIVIYLMKHYTDTRHLPFVELVN